jgi:hypothetical protein
MHRRRCPTRSNLRLQSPTAPCRAPHCPLTASPRTLQLVDALFDSWDPRGSGMLEIAELERQLRRGAELQGLEAPSTPQPTTPGGKRRSLPAFMQTRDAGGQLGSSSSLPALPSAHGRVPREAPTLILPNAFDASIFDATAVYETTQDAHNHGSRQLFERTREAVQEASAAAYNAGQMAAEAAATAGRAGAAAAAARASVEEIRRARKGLASQ